MPKKPKVIILRAAGTNCDQETAFAFKNFGAQADLVHVNQLRGSSVCLDDYHILAIPGGFTYGDDIASGKILANELRIHLGEGLCRFLAQGKLILGICNGFQILVKAGILPGPLDDEQKNSHDYSQKVTLTHNDSGKFEDRWTYLKTTEEAKSVWTEGMEEIVYFPVAHGEGKFVVSNEEVLKKLKNNHRIVFQYCAKDGNAPSYPENPNGSVDHIAGITDRTGRILGLMPHPERHFLSIQHPFWTRLKKKSRLGDGARIFENGVRYVREKLL